MLRLVMMLLLEEILKKDFDMLKNEYFSLAIKIKKKQKMNLLLGLVKLLLKIALMS